MSQGAAAPGMGLQTAVADRLDTMTGWKVRIWAPLVLGMMMMGDSWDIGVIGYVAPSLREEWNLSSMELGALISSGFAGQAIGALLIGPLAEKFGRLYILNAAVVLMCVMSIACGMAQDPTHFFWLRFAQGLGFGGAVPVCVSYVNELAPTKTRGRYFSLFQFLLVAGFAICGFVGAAIIPTHGWRIMFFIGAFPMLFTPFILYTLPESPRWLARLGRIRATNRALIKLGAAPVDESLTTEVVEEAASIPLREIFGKRFVGLTAASCSLWFLTALVGYGFSTWTPTLYVDEFGLSLGDALFYSSLTGAAYMLTPLVFAVILDKVGRRPTGIVVSLVTFAVLVVLALTGSSGGNWSVALMAAGWITSAACFVLLWPYTAEVFPTRMRSTGLGLCSASARVGSTLTPLLVAFVLAATGSIGAVFAVLGVATLGIVLLWTFAAREMTGRQLEEADAL